MSKLHKTQRVQRKGHEKLAYSHEAKPEGEKKEKKVIVAEEKPVTEEPKEPEVKESKKQKKSMSRDTPKKSKKSGGHDKGNIQKEPKKPKKGK
jgi:hypothetical protein